MRGSRPGERRGGSQKGTPNKKTAFRNAVIAARSANENLTPLDVMLAVIRDPQVSLADRVKMALKALPRLHRKPKAGQSGNAIAGSRAATVQSFGTRSSLTRWRQRMGEAKLTALIQESLSVATRTGAAKPADFCKVIVDPPVQPKA